MPSPGVLTVQSGLHKSNERFWLQGVGFKTEYVRERVVQQVCEAKGLTMFGEPGNKSTPDYTTAGANSKRAARGIGIRKGQCTIYSCLGA